MNVNPRSAKGKQRLAAARISRVATDADVTACPFHGVCFSLGLQGCSSDLPTLSWHFGHEGNYYEARHAACRQEKKTVENYQRIGLQPYLRP
jgi:hypothetical protein